MKTIKYMRIKSYNQTGRYAFSPTYGYSSGGTSVPGYGQPSGTSAAVNGSSIWPPNRGTYATGWVGTKIRPTQPVINFQFSADDNATIYLNGQQLFTTIGWGSWAYKTINVTPGKEYAISIYVADTGGGAYGVTGRIYYNDGTAVVLTSTSWVSA